MLRIFYAAGITNTKDEMNEDATEADIDDEHEVSTDVTVVY